LPILSTCTGTMREEEVCGGGIVCQWDRMLVSSSLLFVPLSCVVQRAILFMWPFIFTNEGAEGLLNGNSLVLVRQTDI
jgi:hypothetical protein